MISVRPAAERGHASHGWLDTWHTFSFADYYDPAQVRFRSLRVMNEDRIAAGMGFGTHPHHDMEIVTYVLSGALEHKDSMGNGEILRPGEFQRMSAGTGITHSEFNPSESHPVHLYQIWLFPERKGIEPSYEQKAFSADGRRNAMQLVASRTGESGSLKIHTDASVYLADLTPGTSLNFILSPNRYGWLQVLKGSVVLNGLSLGASDGAAISETEHLQIESNSGAEIMFFDLA